MGNEAGYDDLVLAETWPVTRMRAAALHEAVMLADSPRPAHPSPCSSWQTGRCDCPPEEARRLRLQAEAAVVDQVLRLARVFYVYLDSGEDLRECERAAAQGEVLAEAELLLDRPADSDDHD